MYRPRCSEMLSGLCSAFGTCWVTLVQSLIREFQPPNMSNINIQKCIINPLSLHAILNFSFFFVSCRFVSLCLISFRFFPLHFVSFRFDRFRFVRFRFVLFDFVSFRSVSFRSVSFRFYFVSHFTDTTQKYQVLCIGECPNNSPFLKNNGYCF